LYTINFTACMGSEAFLHFLTATSFLWLQGHVMRLRLRLHVFPFIIIMTATQGGGD
jgi:hypothetical protein